MADCAGTAVVDLGAGLMMMDLDGMRSLLHDAKGILWITGVGYANGIGAMAYLGHVKEAGAAKSAAQGILHTIRTTAEDIARANEGVFF